MEGFPGWGNIAKPVVWRINSTGREQIKQSFILNFTGYYYSFKIQAIKIVIFLVIWKGIFLISVI
jgi:hypothetical protein